MFSSTIDIHRDEWAAGVGRCAVRKFLHAPWAGGPNPPEQACAELELVTDELLTNASKYGHGENVHLCMNHAGDHAVHLTVSYESEPFNPNPGLPEETSDHGRGLALINMLLAWRHWSFIEGKARGVFVYAWRTS